MASRQPNAEVSRARGASRAAHSAGPARVTLRQLCHLGLPATLLLPSLLPVLREVVAASHAGFFFCDALGGITNLYAERMLSPQVMAAYHDRHSNHRFRQQYLQRVAAHKAISWRSVDAQERDSAYYRDVLAPLGVAHFLYAIVRHQGRVLGQLSLYRGSDEPAFDSADELALQSVLHYLGLGLSTPTPTGLRDLKEAAVEEGLAVFDAQGLELYADANWSRLVRLAHGNAITPACAMAERETLPRFVSAALATLVAAPHVIHGVHTVWGRFAFRRHAMSAADGSQVVGLLLSRLAAEPLRLAQGAAELGLSPQQREVAVLIAQGNSNAEIAARLGVTTHTASYHAKQVFRRLDVHERSDVARALSLAAAVSAAGDHG